VHLHPAASSQCPHGGRGTRGFVRGFSDNAIISMLGPNPTHERFRLTAYYVTDLAFQASGDEPLG
jgi:hypothetical protein